MNTADSVWLLTTLIFVALMVAAAVMDWRTRRITNRLNLLGLAAGLVLRGFAGGDPLVEGLLGAGLALLITMPLFALGGIGGGDAKLCMAVGAFMGPSGLMTALLVSALAGGVLALLISGRRGMVVPVLYGTKDLALRAITLGRYGERRALDSLDSITVPYGVAIGFGSVVAWFL